ncbi:peptidoglycan-binding domain-containing protein [Streptomyces marincola]|uniref:peptidoglycan-binding domain-containing protein n=1 Tax=Streptomyces marincola TaxID=2878388 RepID=UPI001CF4152D|nr:peptidoglycan-binding domain-containing protein [Streptomyces marincola]UCM87638.1 peptidoglycan-binding protein [Streptomyces marincola]
MTIDRSECLICGRPVLPTGEPDCECWTHSLSRPVEPPLHGPDPADVALFPVDASAPGRRQVPTGAPRAARAPGSRPAPSVPQRPTGTHRKPRGRTRIATAAGGAVAAVVGCTALAASILSGQGRQEQAHEPDGAGPSLAQPDGGDARPDPPPPPAPDREGADAAPGPGPADPERSEPEGGEGTADSERTESAPPDEEPSEPPSADRPEPDPVDPEPTPDAPPAPGPETPATPEPPAPSEPPAGAGPVLGAGDEGPEVAELQRRLLQLNWLYHGEAHGRYDEQTAAAVARFQVAYGVRGDPEGLYGPQTRRALEQHTRL